MIDGDYGKTFVLWFNIERVITPLQLETAAERQLHSES
jgi:hypothetical protein